MQPQLRHVAGAASRAKTNHRRITAVQKLPLLRMATGLWASSGGASSGAWAGSHAQPATRWSSAPRSCQRGADCGAAQTIRFRTGRVSWPDGRFVRPLPQNWAYAYRELAVGPIPGMSGRGHRCIRAWCRVSATRSVGAQIRNAHHRCSRSVDRGWRLIILVLDLFEPVRRSDRDSHVRHDGGAGSAVPVPFSGRRPHDVAGSNYFRL